MQIKKLALKLLKIFLMILVIFTIINLINNIINPEKELNIFGFEFLVADYNCVNPKISKGDLIITKYCSDKKLQTGDIIIYKKANKILIREISNIEKRAEGNVYSTKEKGTDVEDVWKVNLSKIEGKYLFRIWNFGYLILILKNKIFAIIVIILYLLIYIYKLKLKQVKLRRKEKRTKK